MATTMNKVDPGATDKIPITRCRLPQLTTSAPEIEKRKHDATPLDESKSFKLAHDEHRDSIEHSSHTTSANTEKKDNKATGRRLGRRQIAETADDANGETNDSKSKRRTQNRTAQRAFRERKEKYVKELEERIKFLESTQSNAKRIQNENVELKQLVEKLEMENYMLKGMDFTFTFPVSSAQATYPHLQSISFAHNTKASSTNLPPSPPRDTFPAQMTAFHHSSGSNSSNADAESPGSHSSVSSEQAQVSRQHADSLDTISTPASNYWSSTSTENTPMYNGQTSPEVLAQAEADSTNFLPASTLQTSSDPVSNAWAPETFPSTLPTTTFDDFSDPALHSFDHQDPILNITAPILTPSVLDMIQNAQSEPAQTNTFNTYRDPSDGQDLLHLDDFSQAPPDNPLISLFPDVSQPVVPSPKQQDTPPVKAEPTNVYEELRRENAHKYFVDYITSKNTEEQIRCLINPVPHPETLDPKRRHLDAERAWDQIKEHPQFPDFDLDLLCAELKEKAVCNGVTKVIEDKKLDDVLSRFGSAKEHKTAL